MQVLHNFNLQAHSLQKFCIFVTIFVIIIIALDIIVHLKPYSQDDMLDAISHADFTLKCVFYFNSILYIILEQNISNFSSRSMKKACDGV